MMMVRTISYSYLSYHIFFIIPSFFDIKLNKIELWDFIQILYHFICLDLLLFLRRSHPIKRKWLKSFKIFPKTWDLEKFFSKIYSTFKRCLFLCFITCYIASYHVINFDDRKEDWGKTRKIYAEIFLSQMFPLFFLDFRAFLLSWIFHFSSIHKYIIFANM